MRIKRKLERKGKIKQLSSPARGLEGGRKEHAFDFSKDVGVGNLKRGIHDL